MIALSEKQDAVWTALDDPEVTEVFAGGAAAGGKTWLGCLRQIVKRTTYPGTRGFIGRQTFTGLRDSTMKTYFDLLTKMGYKSGEHYTYNAQEHTVKFTNGSEQHFRHMAYMPSDPDYNRFGSTEYTDAFLDEAPEIDQRAAQVILSRLRYKHIEFVLTPELLLTGNPGDHWIKYRFVQDEHGDPVKLPPHRRTILFTLMDNPDKAFREQYAKTLEQLDDYDRARLLYGDWSAQKDILRPFAYAYDDEKHVGQVERVTGARIAIVVDFNLDPFCANLYQMYRSGGEPYCEQFAEISIQNGSIEAMAERLKTIMGHELRGCVMTGDAMGSNRTLGAVNNSSLFAQLLKACGIPTVNFVKTSNPTHGVSREQVNYFLTHFPNFTIDESCTGTRRDNRVVQVDAYNSIIKKNRRDESQQADLIDCQRYMVHAFFRKDIDRHKKTGRWL